MSKVQTARRAEEEGLQVWEVACSHHASLDPFCIRFCVKALNVKSMRLAFRDKKRWMGEEACFDFRDRPAQGATVVLGLHRVS